MSTNGRIPPRQIDATGTRSSTTFLRGDGTWVAPAGSAPAASAVTVTPTGNIAATDVQAALAELDTEKSATSHSHGGISSGVGEILVQDGVTAPPVALENEARADFLYEG